MKKLFKRHYEAIKKRGLIHNFTTDDDFSNKIEEEFDEFNDELFEREVYFSQERTNQEAIDLMMTVVNYLQFKNVDIESELLKNVEMQESRKD